MLQDGATGEVILGVLFIPELPKALSAHAELQVWLFDDNDIKWLK